MLEFKDLVKVYKPKKGAPVRAPDGVSLRFPQTGMVFIPGKSGSGDALYMSEAECMTIVHAIGSRNLGVSIEETAYTRPAR